MTEKEKDYHWDRMVVITAIHGEKLQGLVPKGTDAKSYMKSCTEAGGPMRLEHVRNFVSQMQAQRGPGGTVAGLARLNVLMTIDLFPGPVPTYYLVPSSWYFPGDDKDCKKDMQALIDNAEQNEMANRAQALGISMATGMPSTPPPGSH